MNDNQMRAVVLHSGGLDSTVLLWHLTQLGYEVLPLSIHYGQRHRAELLSAEQVCLVGRYDNRIVNLDGLALVLAGSNSSQVNPRVPVPEGHYAADNMAVTVVPNRNMILLSAAVAYAISKKAQVVAYAAHAGDHYQYPDCRPKFIAALSAAIEECDENPPRLIAPFSHMTKAQIVKRGSELGVPMGLTYSCYKGETGQHCGRCGTCTERAEAFFIAGVPDPTGYEDPDYWRQVTQVPA
jgi:7-cyano-7-deazaguanine synthase